MKRGTNLLLTGILVVGAVSLGRAAQNSPTNPSAPSSPGASAPKATPANSSTTPASAQSAAAAPGTPAAPFDPNKAALLLPAGSLLHVKLTTTLTSQTNKTGDRFTGVVIQPVMSGDKTLVPEGSLIDGHVAFVKPSGRVMGRAQMRIVLDHINTPEDVNYNLAGSLQDIQSSTCTKGVGDNEGTVEGCGKSKKSAAEAAGIVGAIGAGTGASIGVTQDEICRFYGCPGQDPNIAKDAGYGAAIGAGTALIYSLFKHEKQIILVEGTSLTFVVNRAVDAQQPVATAADSSKS